MLITCAECHSEYSDQAKACVHCGAPTVRTGGGSGRLVRALVIAAGLFIVLVVFGNLVYDPGRDAAERAIAECRKTEKDTLLDVNARRLARDTCDSLESNYEKKYGRTP